MVNNANCGSVGKLLSQADQSSRPRGTRDRCRCTPTAFYYNSFIFSSLLKTMFCQKCAKTCILTGFSYTSYYCRVVKLYHFKWTPDSEGWMKRCNPALRTNWTM